MVVAVTAGVGSLDEEELIRCADRCHLGLSLADDLLSLVGRTPLKAEAHCYQQGLMGVEPAIVGVNKRLQSGMVVPQGVVVGVARQNCCSY